LLLGFYLMGLVINLLVCSLILPLSPLLGATLAIILTKGAVAVCTVTTAQRRLNFLAARDLQQVAGAFVLAIVIYLAARNLHFRVAVLLLTITPFFVLMGWWWQTKGRSYSS